MLLLRHLTFFNEFGFHIIDTLLELFATNDRLTILSLKTLE